MRERNYKRDDRESILTLDRMPPASTDAEMGVIGSLLIDPEVYDVVADSIGGPQDFYHDIHQVIYGAYVDLVSRRMKPDFITLCDELETRDQLEKVGGAAYITSLISTVPTSGNAEYYAGIVGRTALMRRLIHVGNEIVGMAFSQDEQAMAKAERLLYSVAKKSAVDKFYSMREMMSEYMDELNYLHDNKGKTVGVPTGYEDIDIMLAGLQKTDLILLGGRPSSGKTSLGLAMGYRAAQQGFPVAVFSLEMGRKLLSRRLMAMASKVDLQRLRTGWIDDHEWDPIFEKAGEISNLPIWVNDTVGNPISSMRRQLRRLEADHGKMALIIVDYLTLIEPDERSDNRVLEVSRISAGLKQLAREFDAPVLVLAQLSREVEKRQNKRPQLSDLRDSGSLEQDADVVMFVYREKYYADREGRELEPGKENIAEIGIAKQRNGPVGTVSLYFKQDQTMFYNLTEMQEEQKEEGTNQ